jgi:hypothetical protein
LPFLDSARGCFGADGPGGGDLEAAGPQNHAEVAPHCRVLVGELHQLQSVVRHLPRQPGVDIHHRTFEIVARTLYRQCRYILKVPVGEGYWQQAFVPGEKVVGQLVVVDASA